MSNLSLKQIQLKSDTEIKPFKSSDQDLNDFLFNDAKAYLREKLAVTYLLEDTEASTTVAYYSLLNDKLLFNPTQRNIWNRINRKISNPKRRKSYPAVKIGRLAVSEPYAHHGIGKEIVDAIKFLYFESPRSGCRFITVDAYKEAISFYEHCGFKFLTEKDEGERTRAMYFDLLSFQQ